MRKNPLGINFKQKKGKSSERKAMSKYRCHGCGACFATKQELGGHLSKGVACAVGSVITTPYTSAHTTRIAVPIAVPVVAVPVATTLPIGDDVATESASATATITMPAEPASINDLLQRPCHDEAKHCVVPATLPHSREEESDPSRAFKLHEVCQ